jgi:UDP-N-acetylmuramate dehydrogenase
MQTESNAPVSHSNLHTLIERLGAGARANEPMANHTSLRVGGAADIFFRARTTARLIEAVDLAADLGVPWRVIGSASNLLIADEGIGGLVVKPATTARSWTRSVSGTEATAVADSGCILASLARQLVQEGLEGLEWAVNVPGTVGGAVVDNAGAFGSSTAERLVDATVYLPGEGQQTMTAQQLDMGYRTSRLKRGELRAVVVSATFRVEPTDPGGLDRRMRETQQLRQTTQPTGPSLGSMFANPPDDAAGRLIEAAGLKGRVHGGAEVSTLHANFMLNRGGARARDVLGLIQEIQHGVWQSSGRWLIPEVQLAGRWRDDDWLSLCAPPGALEQQPLRSDPRASLATEQASR